MGGKQVPLVNVSNWPSCVWNVAHPSLSGAVTPCHPPWAAAEQMRLLDERLAHSTPCTHTLDTHIYTTFRYTLISFLGKWCCSNQRMEWNGTMNGIVVVGIVAEVHVCVWEMSTVSVRPAIQIRILYRNSYSLSANMYYKYLQVCIILLKSFLVLV